MCSTRTVFEPDPEPQILELNGWRLGISICEDVWNDRDFWKRPRYHRDPIETLADMVRQAHQICRFAVHGGKQLLRQTARAHVEEVRPAAGVRESGRRQRRPDFRRPQRGDSTRRADCSAARAASREVRGYRRLGRERRNEVARSERLHSPRAEIWNALVLGVRDYARKTRFKAGAARPPPAAWIRR
jgi:NAD+ synthase/NAD+ synthase (glutamine-hydrolysing)